MEGFAVEHLCCGSPCWWLGGGCQGPGRLSRRTACPQLFAAENDNGLAEHRWCNLAYCLGSGCPAYEQKPFWSSTVEHQSLEALSETTEHALHGGTGDISGCRISLGQPANDAAGTQPR